MKTAFITGISGQDGAYLAELLLARQYRVIGSRRRGSSEPPWRLEALGLANQPNLQLVEHDVTDLASSIRLLELSQPDEIYNLAAQSSVGVSFDQPTATAQVTALGALNLLEAIRLTGSKSRFYQASTSELFGKAVQSPQDEQTPFWPRSPYGVSKLFAHWSAVNYREAYGMFAACGILFNHESPLRDPTFVSRKITSTVARIASGRDDCLVLGNIDVARDWGYAREYVDGMWRMLQAPEPDTIVLATGRSTTVREFVALAFAAAGIPIAFEGNGIEEIGRDQIGGRIVVRIDPSLYRYSEVKAVVGNPDKAWRLLAWRASCAVEELCAMMVAADLRTIEQGGAA